MTCEKEEEEERLGNWYGN